MTTMQILNATQLARELRVAPQTLRNWIKELEVEPTATDALGRALYGERELRRLAQRARGVVQYETR